MEVSFHHWKLICILSHSIPIQDILRFMFYWNFDIVAIIFLKLIDISNGKILIDMMFRAFRKFNCLPNDKTNFHATGWIGNGKKNYTFDTIMKTL